MGSGLCCWQVRKKRRKTAGNNVGSLRGTSKVQDFVFYSTSGKRLDNTTFSSAATETYSRMQTSIDSCCENFLAKDDEHIPPARRNRRKSYIDAVVEAEDTSSTDLEDGVSPLTAGLRGHYDCDSRNTVANCDSATANCSNFYCDDSDDETEPDEPVRRTQSVPDYVECALIVKALPMKATSGNADSLNNHTGQDSASRSSCLESLDELKINAAASSHVDPFHYLPSGGENHKPPICTAQLPPLHRRQLIHLEQHQQPSSDQNNNNNHSHCCAPSNKRTAIPYWPQTTVV